MRPGPHMPGSDMTVLSVADGRPKVATTDAAGDIVIDAAFLADRLGLSEGMLRQEMRRGIVYQVTERGTGEDEGRLRITFRYRARRWRGVIDRDGVLLSED